MKAAAVILAGAVAKGAFEAGALGVLAERGVPVRRLVAASSGALNATLYAWGVRARDQRQAAALLAQLWEDDASWSHVFHVDARDLLGGTGVSDQTKLLDILRKNVKPVAAMASESRGDIDVTFVVAPLDGREGDVGGRPASTFEAPIHFEGAAFDDATSLEPLFQAAVASAAFPGAFAPVLLPGLGPCVDGGTVNNTPIGYALAAGDVDTVIVIAPTVEHVEGSATPAGERQLHGFDLVGHLADMLINERLYRDLRDVYAVNAALDRLAALGLGDADLARVKAAVGLDDKRRVDVVSIRPPASLPGNSFSGFFDVATRRAYLAEGRRVAEAVLASLTAA